VIVASRSTRPPADHSGNAQSSWAMISSSSSRPPVARLPCCSDQAPSRNSFFSSSPFPPPHPPPLHWSPCSCRVLVSERLNPEGFPLCTPSRTETAVPLQPRLRGSASEPDSPSRPAALRRRPLRLRHPDHPRRRPLCPCRCPCRAKHVGP
jgi:hypothetical protein